MRGLRLTPEEWKARFGTSERPAVRLVAMGKSGLEVTAAALGRVALFRGAGASDRGRALEGGRRG